MPPSARKRRTRGPAIAGPAMAPPGGMRDLLPPASMTRTLVWQRLMETFDQHGYQRVTTPPVEYAEVIERGLGTVDRRDLVRFVEPDTGEVALLRRLDRGRRRIAFEDIAAPGFDPGRYGLDAGGVMARIHGVLADGTVVEGMEVFRRAYAAVGLGWLLAPSAWPGLRRLFDAAYRLFARNRLRWTGRAGVACEAERCSRA